MCYQDRAQSRSQFVVRIPLTIPSASASAANDIDSTSCTQTTDNKSNDICGNQAIILPPIYPQRGLDVAGSAHTGLYRQPPALPSLRLITQSFNSVTQPDPVAGVRKTGRQRVYSSMYRASVASFLSSSNLAHCILLDSPTAHRYIISLLTLQPWMIYSSSSS